MERRLKLHEILCNILDSRNAYFQPPEGISMKYPAIRYSLANVDTEFANNNPYILKKRYALVLIDEDPDSLLFDKIISLPGCSFQRSYPKDGLNHFNFILNY